MKTREPHIPLFLWVATAALVHILWGGGAEQVAAVFEDHSSIARLAASVRRHVDTNNRQLEVTLLDDFDDGPPPLPTTVEGEPAEPEVAPEDEPKDDQHFDEKDDKDDPKAPAELTKEQEKENEKKAKLEQQKVDKNAPKPEVEPEPEKPKPEPEKKAPAEPTPPLPQVSMPQRVSVKQHVADKNQEDNPNAKYQADEANKVAQETQSRITSTDQDDPAPTPGVSHLGPDPKAGNAHVTDIAQSESSPGDPDDAPSQSSKDGKEAVEQQQAKAQAPKDPSQAVFGDSATGGRATQQPTPGPRQPKPTPGQTAREHVEAREAIAEVMMTDGESQAQVAAAQEAQAARRARKARAAIPKLKPGGSAFGGSGQHGRLGLTPGGLNPNLSPLAALETIGSEQLQRERIADGERRRSTHRGSWQTVGLERWRSAIENYIPTARDGNTTALNTARVPFSSYLNQIHNRLHPIFADRFLASLDALPGDHPANRSGISTNLEIVLDPADGRIVRMGVTKASGTTVFDVNALEAVQRASPFGTAPDAIVSPDGNVYLHWEFHREPNLACSTYFARPKMLRVAPQSAPPTVPLRPPATPEEHGSNDKRPPPEQSGG
jgi:TonB family protein